MSREIKFRAWDNESSEWIYSKPMPDMSFWKWVQYDSTTIFNESTGLKDRNGVEIYEGDIVRTYHPFSKFDYNDEKDFCDGEWLCEWEAPRFIFTPVNGERIGVLTRTGGELCEVIGNKKARTR